MSVRNIDDIRPPITTTARGFCSSAQTHVLVSIGNNQITEVNAVIKIGRSLVRAHSCIA